jgi:hypothetical protein
MKLVVEADYAIGSEHGITLRQQVTCGQSFAVSKFADIHQARFHPSTG